MAAFPKDLEAKPGELIYPKWVQLQDWLRRFKLIKGPGVDFRQEPNGTYVRATASRSWPHSFRVGVDGLQAVIGTGTVNGQAPLVQGVPLDGVDPATKQPVEVPPLPLTPPDGGRGFSWVGIQAAAHAESFTLAHVLDTEGDIPAGFQPLARIEWADGRAVQTWQIVRHHLNAAEVQGRFYFWAI